MASPRAGTLLWVVLGAKEKARPGLSRRLVGNETPGAFCVVRLESKGDGEAGVVAQAGRNRVAGGFLRGQDGEAEGGAAFADEFAGERDAAAGEAFHDAVAFVLAEIEVGLALIRS